MGLATPRAQPWARRRYVNTATVYVGNSSASSRSARCLSKDAVPSTERSPAALSATTAVRQIAFSFPKHTFSCWPSTFLTRVKALSAESNGSQISPKYTQNCASRMCTLWDRYSFNGSFFSSQQIWCGFDYGHSAQVIRVLRRRKPPQRRHAGEVVGQKLRALLLPQGGGEVREIGMRAATFGLRTSFCQWKMLPCPVQLQWVF